MKRESEEPRPENPAARVIAEAVVAAVGLGLIVCALAARQPWLDRHFLPSFFFPRWWYVLLQTTVRVIVGLSGVGMAFAVRPAAGRLMGRAPGLGISVVAAAVLALGASEMWLRHVEIRPLEWLLPEEEPRRQPDALLGWTVVPSRTGHRDFGGRQIVYATDAAGYRVRRVEDAVNPERETIVFTGESVMFGEGLNWDETVPAQVETMMGVQSANIAVHGFANDQAFLRLRTELPRFRQPLAVVSLFMTALLGRNLDDDRPHLGPGLVWLPPEPHPRLILLAKRFVAYRKDETIERGLAVTREILQATVDLARARGAVPLIVVPQFEAEGPVDQMIRRRVLDEPGLPYVRVELDSAWRLAWDRHPNARAAHEIGAAVAARLLQSREHRGSEP